MTSLAKSRCVRNEIIRLKKEYAYGTVETAQTLGSDRLVLAS